MSTSNIKFKIVDVTPDMARKYLGHNHSNRNLRMRKVAEYARTMEQGFWRVTGDGISLDSEGKLIDGQHRLQAILQYGKPVTMAVIKGVDAGSQQYMDCGAPRRVADNLKMFDGEKNASLLVTASKALNLFDTGTFDTMIIDEVRKVIKKHRAQFDWLPSVMSKDLPRSGYFYAPFLWLHKHGYEDECAMFLDEMTTMAGLTRNSPVIALTKALDRKGGNGGYNGSLTIMMLTLNAFRSYAEEETLLPKSLLASSRGFDYFNAEIRVFSKRRRKEICSWSKGCTFQKAPRSGGGDSTFDYCWLHERVRTKRSDK